MTTAAAMLNDFGGWTLIAWQPAFYERVHHLPVETYSHLLAIILPVGGALGGIGGGFVADYVAGRFPAGRKWLLQVGHPPGIASRWKAGAFPLPVRDV